MAVIVHLCGADGASTPDETIPPERVFHLFFDPESEADVLIRSNPNDRPDDELSDLADRLLAG